MTLQLNPEPPEPYLAAIATQLTRIADALSIMVYGTVNPDKVEEQP